MPESASVSSPQVLLKRFADISDRLAVAVTREMELRDQKPLIKDEAIRRTMGRDGVSYSAAERTAEDDSFYAEHLKLLRYVAENVQRLHGQKTAIEMQFRLAMLLLEHSLKEVPV